MRRRSDCHGLSSPGLRDQRFLSCHSLFRDPERQFPSSALTFDPPLVEQVPQYYLPVGEFEGLNPIPTSQALHELAFALRGDYHHLLVSARFAYPALVNEKAGGSYAAGSPKVAAGPKSGSAASLAKA